MARRRPGNPLRQAFGGTDWTLIVLTKDGGRDFVVVVFALLHLHYMIAPGASWIPGVAFGTDLIDFVWFALGPMTVMGSGNWLLGNGFVRTRSVLRLPGEQYPWFRCLVDRRFLLVLAVVHLVGLAVLMLGGWVTLNMYGPLMTHWGAYGAIYGVYDALGAAWRMPPPAL